MTETTSNHGWTIPTVGGDTDQWGTILNDFFDGELDRQVTLEDTISNRPSASSTTVKFFHATDEDIIYYNNDSSWNAIAGLGNDVESFATSGGSGTAPVSQGDGTLSMTDIATQSELNGKADDPHNNAAHSVNYIENNTDTVDDDNINLASLVVENPELLQLTELADTESTEISIPVADGETLEVYRWGGYDANDGTAPTGLDVELLDGSDTVQASENTVNTEDKSTPVASYTNSSGSQSIFKLRVYNGTGGTIPSTDGDPGVGAHFGYVVV